MTSTLGGWILTGYGAAKAPRLMKFSVHCDHLRSISFWRAAPSLYGEMLAVLTTLLRKKICASIYGHGKGQELGAFQIFLSCSPALQRNTGRFERVFSDIRRKTCCFDQVFSQNFFCFLHHTEKRMPFC